LSAHIKLLLDAPEHLWRLIERKKYFQAGWLFLLARVVHRALVRDDDQDEENWANQGIDITVSLVKLMLVHLLSYRVQEQFPLIQRQWDAVSHFRTQIIHKATLSLRLYTAPSEVCQRLPICCRSLMHLGRILAPHYSLFTFWILGRSQRPFLYFSLSGLKLFILYLGNHPILSGPWTLIRRV
jgi:hypothetical protein